MRRELGQHAGVVEARTGQLRRHAELDPLLLQQVDVAAGGESDDAEVVAVAAQDIERLGPDGSGRSEDDDAGGHGPRLGGHPGPSRPNLGFFTGC